MTSNQRVTINSDSKPAIKHHPQLQAQYQLELQLKQFQQFHQYHTMATPNVDKISNPINPKPSSSSSQPSSVPFISSNPTDHPQQPLQRPSSETSSSYQPHHRQASQSSNSSPGKKKESILRKLSISSRRSLAWLPGIHDHPSPSGTSSNPSTTTSSKNHKSQTNSTSTASSTASNHSKVKFYSTTASKSITPPNSEQSNTSEAHHHSHSSKNVIGKSMRSVARTVKKSLHQFDRPRTITGDHLNQHAAESKTSHPQAPDSRHSSSTSRPGIPGPSGAQRTRAVSTSEVYNERSVRSRTQMSSTNNLSQSLTERSSHRVQPPQSGQTTPPRSPNRLKKSDKPRPLSTNDSHSSKLNGSDYQTTRLSWHAHTHIGSLPLAASILAAPSPPPIDHSTFMAIIPGRKSPAVGVPFLSVVAPAASEPITPGALTAMSVKVEPPQSRRVSPSSSIDPSRLNDENNGFAFIGTPSAQPPSDLAVKSRPPLVSTATAISLVQSCVAEHGSISEIDENISRVPSSGYLVGDQVETLVEQTTSTSTDELRIIQSSLEHEFLKPENRKRKVTPTKSTELLGGQTNDPSHCVDDSNEEIESRQHKVFRSINQPFSSSTSTALGMNHSTSHPLSVLPINPATVLADRSHQDHSSRCKQLPSHHHNHLKNRKRSTRRKNSNGLSSNHPHEDQDNHDHDQHPNNEVWNFSIVSTVVGVVIIAVVLIGSTNLTGSLNGKSWIGNLIKKMT